ncbi:MAG: hypothetical protein R3B82_22295 [Sandaracinaceae bacterium]
MESRSLLLLVLLLVACEPTPSGAPSDAGLPPPSADAGAPLGGKLDDFDVPDAGHPHPDASPGGLDATSPAPTCVDSPPVRVSESGDFAQTESRVAVAGDVVAVFWTDRTYAGSSDLRMRRFDRRTLAALGEPVTLADENLGDTTTFVPVGLRDSFVIAYDRAWGVSPTRARVRGRMDRLGTDGARLEAWHLTEVGGIPVAIAANEDRLLFVGGYTPVMARFLDTGAPDPEPAFRITPGRGARGRTVAYDAMRDRWLMVFEGLGGGLVTQVIGEAMAPIPVSVGTAYLWADLAVDDGGFGLVYQHAPGSAPWVTRFQRLDGDGAPIGAPRDIAEGRRHALAWSGHEHGVLILGHGESPSLGLHFVDRDGEPIGRLAELGAVAPDAPDVAWDGEARFLVSHTVDEGASHRYVELRALCPPR